MAKTLKRLFVFVVLTGLIVLLWGNFLPHTEDNTKLANYTTLVSEPLIPVDPLSREALNCRAFIDDHLTSPYGGIYTNYQSTAQTGDLSAGHEVLSESMGLLLEYARLTGDQKLFNDTANYIKNYLMVDDILLWRIVENSDPITDVSATIDDLRIYQTLALAKNQWPHNDAAAEIFKTLENQLPLKGFQSGYLVNYYSNASPTQDKTVELAYINLSAIQTLATAKPEMASAVTTNQEILLGSFISESLPLYHKSYDPSKRIYTDADGKINILDSLMVMLNLAHVGIYSQQSIDWLEERTASGTLYSYYDSQTGATLDTQESSAAYGLAAQIGAALGNEFLTGNALSQLKKHQNSDPLSPLYGGFGYNNNAYSYDNLQALLGLVYNK
ncbi:hypothetical protein LNN31_13230 [Acetobacterium wieringae]|jgi:hypothetical protein|uniref:Glycosyl hydrolase family 8 n=1 Tax=Acetobacterium wieringae TaxID=52694 RepID=A0ABY6HB53_9FIRM|nr:MULTISPECIES: hypothetical protein [Acetobacterium]UYO61739.1 hypothetical protein LNN31_13230 [Acetobacterium wieringae]VUZ28169.1 Uncharacterised protein [Acetobacterium wieringae]